MAGNTRNIKRKIRSVNSTMQITKAFELVSSAKLRRARNKLESSKAFFETLENTISDVMKLDRDKHHRYLMDSEFKTPLVVLITSDRGLCGGFNINNIKKALEYENASYYTIGKRGTDYLKNRGYKIVGHLHGVSEKPRFEFAKSVGMQVVNLFNSGEYDSLILVHSEFISTISLNPVGTALLPLSPRQNAAEDAEEKKAKPVLMNYEPDRQTVLEYIAPKYVESLIFGAMIESSASEQAARRLAMESATDNASEIISDLTLTYNRARQAAITQEITEIVGGAEALK